MCAARQGNRIKMNGIDTDGILENGFYRYRYAVKPTAMQRERKNVPMTSIGR